MKIPTSKIGSWHSGVQNPAAGTSQLGALAACSKEDRILLLWGIV